MTWKWVNPSRQFKSSSPVQSLNRFSYICVHMKFSFSVYFVSIKPFLEEMFKFYVAIFKALHFGVSLILLLTLQLLKSTYTETCNFLTLGKLHNYRRHLTSVTWKNSSLARNQYGNFQSRRKTIKKVSLSENWVWLQNIFYKSNDSISCLVTTITMICCKITSQFSITFLFSVFGHRQER